MSFCQEIVQLRLGKKKKIKIKKNKKGRLVILQVSIIIILDWDGHVSWISL